jgi:TatA/E family protein of Tat protein translocase
MGPLGIPEIIAIFIVALVVFGPKKLPELGKSLGKGLREFNKAKNELKATWDEQLVRAENSSGHQGNHPRAGARSNCGSKFRQPHE